MTSTLYILALALFTQVSAPERNSAAATKPAPAQTDRAAEQGPALSGPLLEKAMDGLSSLGDTLASFQKPHGASDEKRAQGSATMVWARVSKRFLADKIERDVDRTKPVQDYILGTTIHGESRTTGKTHFVLHSNDDQALGEVEFVGEVHAKTIGHNGLATLHYLSDSTFRAHKQITITDSGLKTSAAVADAPTHLTATSIQTSLPRLRGRIAQRIAWRRVASSQRQADAIVSDHTAADIREGFDRRLNESVAAIQTQLQSQIAELNLDGEKKSMVMRSRSTPDYIEVAFCRRGASPDEMRMPSVAVEGNPDIAIRVHRSMLALVMSNPKLREKIAPLLGNSFVASPGQAVVLSQVEQPLKSTKLAMDGEWLVVGLTANAVEPTPRVALEERPLDQRVK